MAGTIFGIGLSQRVDTNGKPDAGWLLYLYAANSSTPVTAYKDTALTSGLELPWPIEADSSGMMPSFWLADGSYRARATSNDGSRVFFDLTSVLALGASAGAAPSGGVDPTAIFQIGDTLFIPVSGTRSGWVRDNGRTIGSATSGASERANADCQALFEYYWNTYTDAQCPVSTGRGASAAADWGANKQIATLDMRGVGAVGLDDMGNSAASRFTGVPFVSGDATTAGSIAGENTAALLQANLPSVNLSLTAGQFSYGTSVGVTHGNTYASGGSGPDVNAVTLNMSSNPALTVPLGGSGTAVNKVSRSVTGTWYRKL